MAHHESGLRKATRQLREYNSFLRAGDSLMRTQERMSGRFQRIVPAARRNSQRVENHQGNTRAGVDLNAANVPARPESIEQWVAKKNLSEEQVKEIQGKISAAFPNEIVVKQSGKYDNDTIAAVKFAQTKLNVSADGKYGDKTEALLNKKIADNAIKLELRDSATTDTAE